MQTRILLGLAAAIILAAAGCESDCSCGGEDGGAGDDGGSDADTDQDAGAEDPLDDFFDLEIHEIQVTLSGDAVGDLTNDPRTYTHASVTVDGEEYEDVGLRLKGGAGSFIPWGGDYPEISGDGNGNPGKNAFIVDFNRFVKGLDHLGLEKLTVNNLVQDPSCIHEFLGYLLFRSGGVPASRSGWAMVTVNDEEKGLYALIETPDNDEFLEKHFGEKDGNLYEGEYGTDLTGETYQSYDQDNGTDESKGDLAELAGILETAAGSGDPLDTLAEHFDLPAYLAFAATEIYLGHWDGYAVSTNNYAIYHDLGDDRWSFVPWGIDQLFVDELGPYAGVIGGPGPAWDHGGVVHRLCFASETCRSMLADEFRDLFDRVEELELGLVAEKARALVEEQALAEAGAHGDPELTREALDGVYRFIERREEQLLSWLPCLEGGEVDNDDDSSNGCTADCNDHDPGIHPGADEVCDFVDQDCNGVLDDPAECPSCKEETGPDGATYAFCLDPLSFDDALAGCRGDGGDLVSIHDDELREFVAFRFHELAGVWESWIGLSDQTTEGSFGWTDSSALGDTPWCEESPDSTPDNPRDCVAASIECWRDIPCSETLPYTCKTTKKQ